MSLYAVVIFVDDQGPNNIDLVPTDWIYYDVKDKHLYCRFINANPTPEESQYLQNLVKNRNVPDENWNSYRLEVRGVADKYDEAVEKLTILKQRVHAFSTDDEKKIKEKQEEIKQKCLLKGNQKQNVKTKFMSSRLDLSKPVNEEDRNREKLPKSSSDEDSSEENEIRNIVWNITMANRTLMQNLTEVMSKFFTANMINKMTSQKQTGDKTVFKDTQFGSCLFDIMREDLEDHGIRFKDKEFYDTIGRIINNAKTWNKENKNNK